MKKLLALICCLALVLAMFAGCAGDTSTDTNTNDTTSDATNDTTSDATNDTTDDTTDDTTEEVNPEDLTGTLTYWTYTDTAYQLTEQFAEKYPNITVDVQVFGGDEYKTKILTALQSGTDVPDMFDLEEGYVYEFLDSDVIADLSYIDIENLTANYYDYQKASMKDSNGNYKCLTFMSNPVCFWYLRDACEQWLGTSDPDEISAMITSWDDMFALQEEVYEASNGEVAVFGTISEMPKVSAFSFDPLVQNGELVISDDWIGLIDDMRTFYNSGYDPEYGSWSGEWATAWNTGKLLFRAMPSWDYFTDWDVNTGNVGLAAPFLSSFEGQTCLCVYNESENKDLAGVFLSYIASDEFQIANMEVNNQVPASRSAIEAMADGYSAEKYGGQNILATFSDVLENVEAITPDKYTRSVQNLFQNTASNGIKEGKDNDTIIAEFKSALADQYPEVVIN